MLGSMRHRISVLVLLAFLVPTYVTSEAKAARLSVEDLMVFYDTIGPASAEGRIEFNLRHGPRGGGPPLAYDLFVAQVMISKALMGNSASFTLNTFATQDTAAIGPSYWLPNSPTGFQVASTHGGEFRFRDRTTPSAPIAPEERDVLARFVIDFQVNSVDEFGEYTVHAGSSSANFFGFFILNSYPNVISPLNFILIPEPASGLFFLMAGSLILRHRRRRRG
ncbi:MAG: hypothetical protein MI923_04780 [Phycisphaerales bacterium]|nr:hypothetical protein [Phycisphaerales bacterium]